MTPRSRAGDLVVGGDGFAQWSGKTYRCAVGRGGLVEAKREGDGATPVGRFPLRQVLYRPDRLPGPSTALPLSAITPSDAWCEDPSDPSYNRLVTLGPDVEHDRLWRDDHIYDVVVVVGYNDSPPVPGKGSAIFLHLARDGYPPTAGCIAFSLADLLDLLSTADEESHVEVGPHRAGQPMRSARPAPSA